MAAVSPDEPPILMSEMEPFRAGSAESQKHPRKNLDKPTHQRQPTGTHITSMLPSPIVVSKMEQEETGIADHVSPTAAVATTLLDILQEGSTPQKQHPVQQLQQLQTLLPTPNSSSASLNTTTVQSPTHITHAPSTPAPTPSYTPRPTNLPSPSQQQQKYEQQQLQQLNQQLANQQQLQSTTTTHPGRRSITLRLLEELPPVQNHPILASPLLSSVNNGIKTPFKHLRRFRSMSLAGSGSGTKEFFGGSNSSSTPKGKSKEDPGVASTTALGVVDEKKPLKSNSSTGLTVDRGSIVVSWYEGTTSGEMQDHVFNCVLRKLGDDKNSSSKISGGKRKLEDVRLLDENEEVVLCPFLPDKSHFLLKFKITTERPATPPPPPPTKIPPYVSRAPDSPSAEPSRFPSNADMPSLLGLGKNSSGMGGSMGQQQQQQQLQSQQQLQTQQMLGAVAAMLQQQQHQQQQGGTNGRNNRSTLTLNQLNGVLPRIPDIMDSSSYEESVLQDSSVQRESPREEKKDDINDAMDAIPTLTVANAPIISNGIITAATDDNSSQPKGKAVKTPRNTIISPLNSIMEPIVEEIPKSTDQLIEKQLRQLNELFTQRRTGIVPTSTDGAVGTAIAATTTNTTDDPAIVRAYQRDEKKQVIFVIANYLVLFLSLIALSAEIQSRLPQWMETVQSNYDSVQNCATNREALTECLANGDFSGLVASFLLWVTQSVAAKRIFLFGFDTPFKLWTVVYEALVSAVCWGTSYLFIRRGLNPNTRSQFLHKYWKDAVYGSLAGFNAAFMKAVLKNLIPQEVALEALEGRQLRIFHWLGSLMAEGAE